MWVYLHSNFRGGLPGFRLLLGLYRVGDCVMHLCPICNRRTINVLDDDDDDDDDECVLKQSA